MSMKMDRSMVWPIAGTMAVVGAAAGIAMLPRKKKRSAQKAAGRAIKAVGEAVENFSANFKM